MKFLDAAHEILRQANQPLHYTEIAARALEAGLLDTRGQTPEATMGSRLYTDSKRPGSRFRKTGRGVFGLATPETGGIARRIAALNRQTRTELRKRLHEMPPERFEALASELMIAIGFDEATVRLTAHQGDGGIDVRGIMRAGGIAQVQAAVQVKRWKRNVQARTVRDVRGSLTVQEQGIIITTSGVSSGARKEAEAAGKKPISLIGGDELLELLIRHGIGVTEEQHTLLSIDEEWWGEVAGEPSAPDQPAKTDVVELPRVTYPLRVRGTAGGQMVGGELLDASGRMRHASAVYRSPSGAGQAATGWKSCNGWTWWRYEDPDTGEWRPIDELRR